MWTNSKCSADLVTITEEIFNEKLHFQCNDKSFENFTENDILWIMKTFNVSKVHGWDKISIKMIKLYSKTIAMPLKVTFWSIPRRSCVSGWLGKKTK